MTGELLAVAVLVIVVVGAIAFFTDTWDIVVLGLLIAFIATTVFFLNGWWFMLAVGNLGKPFGYWDSAVTAGLLGACFSAVGGGIKASSR